MSQQAPHDEGAPTADVVLGRHVVPVALEEGVPGDLLVLREGCVIAADGVVRWAANLGIVFWDDVQPRPLFMRVTTR